MHPLILSLIALIAAPLAGAVAVGLDRKITARFQSRYGPPLTQPVYDVIKLFGKRIQSVNRWPPFFAMLYLFGSAASVVWLVAGGNLLVVFFLSTLTVTFLIMGALAAVSPYSRMGAGRELIVALIYEPMLLAVFMGIYHVSGSFQLDALRGHSRPLLFELPVGYLTLFMVFLIKMHKSPFDFSFAHHAHQELVQGLLTEYSGPFLAVVEIGRWYETALLLLLFSLFWHTGAWGAVALAALTYLAAVLLDNLVPRLTWRWTLRTVWIPGLILVFANLAWICWI